MDRGAYLVVYESEGNKHRYQQRTGRCKMTDRELLELAAKAAGIILEWDGPPDEWQPIYYEGKTYRSFNPLTDDGDALRLAIKLGIELHLPWSHNEVFVQVGELDSVTFVFERIDGDPYSATHRAIVRAAAEIGKGMK